jgi:hypothetical protein
MHHSWGAVAVPCTCERQGRVALQWVPARLMEFCQSRLLRHAAIMKPALLTFHLWARQMPGHPEVEQLPTKSSRSGTTALAVAPGMTGRTGGTWVGGEMLLEEKALRPDSCLLLTSAPGHPPSIPCASSWKALGPFLPVHVRSHWLAGGRASEGFQLDLSPSFS